MPRKLKCSFCGKDENEVEKLVAGGKRNLLGASAHICDECVSIAHELMLDPKPPTRGPASQRKTQVEDEEFVQATERRTAA